MTTIIEGDLPHTLPLREDGTNYPFLMAYQNRVVMGDTRTELVADLIPDYAGIDASTTEGIEKSLVTRYECLVNVANQLQQLLAAEAANNGTFDPQVETEDVLTALFTSRDERITVGEWKPELPPLVLLATDYAPYTGDTRPTGNVKFLDPHTETTFLDTLHGVGAIELYVNES